MRSSCLLLLLLAVFSVNDSHSSFLRKWGYLWWNCVGLERVIADTHTQLVLRTWRVSDSEKHCHSPFNLRDAAFSQTSVHSSSGFSTFLMEPRWISVPCGWFHLHVSGRDNISLGLWQAGSGSAVLPLLLLRSGNRRPVVREYAQRHRCLQREYTVLHNWQTQEE